MTHYMHCYILNIEALGFMVSEDFFKVTPHYTVKGQGWHDLCRGIRTITTYCHIFFTLKFKGSELCYFISDLLWIVFAKYTGINQDI